ncbi:MAG: peptidase S8, partial [Chloroflexi bacterium HGW-Chloroflexi-8]
MIKKYPQILLSILILVGSIFSLVQPADAMIDKSPAKQISTIDVDPVVLSEMNAKGSTGYWIEFSDEVDLSPADKMDWSERGSYVFNTLTKAARTSQASTENYLTKAGITYRTHWIKNSIYVTRSDRSVLSGLMSNSGIDSIRSPRTYFLYEPDKNDAKDDNGINAIEPSLAHIHVDDVWGMGYTGNGIVVANMDTGVRYSHEALVNQYRGNNGDGTFSHDYNWFDPYGQYSAPADHNSHGTHTMGTMVGDDGGVNQIGVAPGADWMACRACNTTTCSDEALLTCAEFVAAPTKIDGTAPNPDLRANIVNNSWGDCSQTYDGWFQN